MIQQGAHVVLEAQDLLGLLAVGPAAAAVSSLSLDASTLLSRLSEAPQSADGLAEALDWSASRVSAALTELELSALVRLAEGRAHRC